MLNVFDEASSMMRRAFKEQIDKLRSDLESAVSTLTNATVLFDDEMNEISKARAALDERERKARAKLTQSITANQSIVIALQNQIDSGEIKTGGETVDQSASATAGVAPFAPRRSKPLAIAPKDGE